MSKSKHSNVAWFVAGLGSGMMIALIFPSPKSRDSEKAYDGSVTGVRLDIHASHDKKSATDSEAPDYADGMSIGNILRLSNKVSRLRIFSAYLTKASGDSLMEAEALMQELSQSGYDLATEESLLQLTIGATLGVESMPSDDKRYKAAEFRKKFVERMVGWAQTDADAATNWWRQLPANPRRLLLAGGLVEGMSANNPGSAMTMFRDEFLPTEKAVAARGIGTAILQDSGVDNSVSAWRDFVIGENGPPSMDYESRVAYAVVTDMLLNAVQSVDHDDMLRINELASVGIIDAGSLATLGKRLASVDPILALDEMAQFTAIAGQQYMPPAGLEATAKAVAEAQPAELANWLKLNNEFPGRERIVAVLVEGLGSIDPASAADWSQELPRVVELPDEILQQQ